MLNTDENKIAPDIYGDESKEWRDSICAKLHILITSSDDISMESINGDLSDVAHIFGKAWVDYWFESLDTFVNIIKYNSKLIGAEKDAFINKLLTSGYRFSNLDVVYIRGENINNMHSDTMDEVAIDTNTCYNDDDKFYDDVIDDIEDNINSAKDDFSKEDSTSDKFTYEDVEDTITDEESETFYEKHKNKINIAGGVIAGGIVIGTIFAIFGASRDTVIIDNELYN